MIAHFLELIEYHYVFPGGPKLPGLIKNLFYIAFAAGGGDDLAGRLDHNPVLLDMLFDLTRADGSSLGATSGETISKQYGWSKWRETLVRTMYNATRYHM